MMNAGDEFDYLLDEGEMGNFMDYDMDGGFSDGGGGGSESEDDYALVGSTFCHFCISIIIIIMFHINPVVIKFKCFPLKLGQLTRVTDTSAAQARRGRDIQGIPWNRLHITRQNYRKTRLEQYKNYENIASSGELVDKVLWYPPKFYF